MTLAEFIEKHEGRRQLPYTDTTGHLTIGVGRNLSTKGVSDHEIDGMLQDDIDEALLNLQTHLPWFSQLDGVREAVLVDMTFNLGIAGLLEFKQTLAAIEAQDWPRAHDAMLLSEWAKQVGPRAIEDAQMILTGNWPGDGEVS